MLHRIGVGAAAVTVVAAVAACGDDGSGGELAGAVRTPPLDVAAVSLPSVTAGGDGELVAMQAPPDELYLVYFGYTSCPDVCPTTMDDISVALDDPPDELADRVTPVMATVDPERDTGEAITGYLDHFFDQSLALRTTDAAALTMATEAFGMQWQVEDHAPGEAYDVAHTAFTYVLDDTGTVVVEWPFGFDSESMTSDLRILLEEERT